MRLVHQPKVTKTFQNCGFKFLNKKVKKPLIFQVLSLWWYTVSQFCHYEYSNLAITCASPRGEISKPSMAFVVSLLLFCCTAICSAAPNVKTPSSAQYVGLDIEREKARVSFGGDVYLWFVQHTYLVADKFIDIWQPCFCM